MTSNSRPLNYSPEVEVIPADEPADIQQVVQAVELLLARSHDKTGHFQGDVHVKTQGYARGEFRVVPSLPGELAQGLFQSESVFPAVVRFSNSAPQSQPDAVPDGRGLAIKLLGVVGEMLDFDTGQRPAQDFVMVNHPVFIARNVKDYLRLEQVLVRADDNPLVILHGALTGGDRNPLHWHWNEALAAARIAAQVPAHPARQTYFSMAPIRYGEHVVKYRIQPASEVTESLLTLVPRLGTCSNALGELLEKTLNEQSLSFDFQVQLRTSDSSMPIEDATIEWPESESPYRTVAQLTLPRQEIGVLDQQPEFQSLAFNVWHALAAHRPLGGMNRLRRAVYPLSSAWRRQERPLSPQPPGAT